MSLLIVIMGVSGVGKSTVGAALAKRLGIAFLEGDELHPKANIDKMAAGIALCDDDRFPWLDLIGAKLAAAQAQGASLVVTCSALKRIYRDRLRNAVKGQLHFILLTAPKPLLADRLAHRAGHYMPASLLDSQLQTLEMAGAGENLTTLDSTHDVAALVQEIMAAKNWA